MQPRDPARATIADVPSPSRVAAGSRRNIPTCLLLGPPAGTIQRHLRHRRAAQTAAVTLALQSRHRRRVRPGLTHEAPRLLLNGAGCRSNPSSPPDARLISAAPYITHCSITRRRNGENHVVVMTASYLSHNHIHSAGMAIPAVRHRTFSSSSNSVSNMPPSSSSSSSSFSATTTASFFQLPTTRRRHKQTRLIEQQQQLEQAAAAHEQANLRAQAWLYINDFLDTSSDWSEMREQIAIVCEAVPTMPELNAYGELDEKEGTVACRRLFKAPVVWDRLGHSLWKTLHAAADQRAIARKLFEADWAATLDGFTDVDYAAAAEESGRSGRRRASESTVGTGISSRSSSVSPLDRVNECCGAAGAKVKKQSSRMKLSRKFSPSRRASSDTDREISTATTAAVTLSQQLDHHRRDSSDLAYGDRSATPRIIPSSYFSAMRRTFGLFGDSSREQSR
ncbi:hypothetical protein JDV02_004314 [Purpureocillium takamizusanense]|uniref:Uncharacterized protein n=1 Tax=Purpureocillium takamizusanense TaxID=2060973 RepID=A0A9Q8QEG7_9HYPO|nr:uncharacterized protein JDV02_004314 [Purpureocillium takamizusanense]UNI18013.1 hypothetical protein JDV02_004314 [Purpureocillium takamizusanense]